MTIATDVRGLDASAEERVLTTTAGRRIGYLVRGPKDGQPIVYLHGAPGSRREQSLMPAEALEKLRSRVISLDRPGYGHTDPMEGNRVARAGDVLAAADALGIRRFALLAVSSGGSYALTLAAIAPERIERVVLCSAQMPYDDDHAIEGLQPQQRALLPSLRLGRRPDLETAVRAAHGHFLEDPMRALDPSTVTLSSRERHWYAQPQIREILTDDIREGLRDGYEGLLADLLSWPCPFEVDLGEIQCPVTAVHGTADDWEPLPNLRRALADVRDREVILLDGANHLGPLMKPELLLSLATAHH